MNFVYLNPTNQNLWIIIHISETDYQRKLFCEKFDENLLNEKRTSATSLENFLYYNWSIVFLRWYVNNFLLFSVFYGFLNVITRYPSSKDSWRDPLSLEEIYDLFQWAPTWKFLRWHSNNYHYIKFMHLFNFILYFLNKNSMKY